MKAKFDMMHRFLTISFCVTILLGNMLLKPALAQDDADFMPPQAAADESTHALAPEEATHPALRLTPDKSEMLRLSTDAASIVIGNESNIQILMDSPKRLIVVPREPGATFFTILDKDGNIIMQRHAIVASPKDKYVRIRRSCRTAGAGCEETSIYYCPGMCHDVKIQTNIYGRQTKTNLMPTGINGSGSSGYNDNDSDQSGNVVQTSDEGDEPTPEEELDE